MGSVLEILRKTAASVQPSDRSFNDPALWQQHEALRGVGPLDDFDVDLRQQLGDAFLELRPLIAAIGEELAQEGVAAEQGRQQEKAAIAILNIGRMNDGLHQQALRIDEHMSLLALDPLAGVIALRIDRDPPFSALFTLWESMMQAVGLASLSTFSRHCTYKA